MNPIIMSLVRHGLTALGGVLAGMGYLDASQVEAVVGAVLVLVGAIAGALEKTGRGAPGGRKPR